jgi:superfamily II DNA/RNA helicase
MKVGEDRKKLNVMVTTNLGARGIDCLDIEHVIQFEFAKNPIDYIHRVGRTGRLGQKGFVTNFIRKGDLELV